MQSKITVIATGLEDVNARSNTSGIMGLNKASNVVPNRSVNTASAPQQTYAQSTYSQPQ